ncbi:MAG: 4Fe-4S dicluster domain-containing protein [Candidatus Eisenbacteria bacterium]|nr:4Fe-4S dicluster domain-containing protein [Candidatus Latescibacterota bacterium]MBD3302567.1 4Fe-4S dicluster domain-containing protein [Candidatus Eisenbacteria bacterium]
MATVKIRIDGQQVEAEEGSFLLPAIQEMGVEIPTLCYYKYATPYAACRMCVVEIWDKRKKNKVVTACNYPIAEGLEVLTHSPRVVAARRTNLEMLMSRCAPMPVLQEMGKKLGIEEPRWGWGTDTCILCGLCVRVCDEIVGARALGFASRGADRYVTTAFDGEADSCILCGACASICPTEHIQLEEADGRKIIHDEVTLGPNSAISVPFRQAVPNVPRIDPEYCIHFRTGGCTVCSQVCPKDCIHYDEQEKTEEIEVGTIVLATGFQDLDPEILKPYGYGKIPNVITAMEFERMNNAAGSTGGKIQLQNGAEPRSIAILHCIGSRDERHHPYCSRVCCMYGLKFAHLVKEKTEAEVYQLYIDLRAFGKGYEEFYQRILSEGVNVIRGKGTEVVRAGRGRAEEGDLLVRCEDTLAGVFREIPVDMVILCTALEAHSDAKETGRKFGVSIGADGWFIERHPKLGPVSTATDGVFLAGVCQGPKDIPDTVAQGGAAAAEAMSLMIRGEVEMDAACAVIDEEKCCGCRLCNDLCAYSAITFDEEKEVSVVNEALCKACGTCVAGCPSGSIKGLHFTDPQIYAEIEGILS